MREIKFRAFDLHSKEMVGVRTIDWDDSNRIEEINTSTYCHGLERDPFETIVLMQFTGLKDRDGKDVYEGDIIDSETKAVAPWVVSWKGAWVKFVLSGRKNFPSKGMRPQNILASAMRIPRMKVIGNIYENPELLYPSNQEN